MKTQYVSARFHYRIGPSYHSRLTVTIKVRGPATDTELRGRLYARAIRKVREKDGVPGFIEIERFEYVPTEFTRPPKGD